MLDEDELFERASRAYRRRCENSAETYQEPARYASTLEGSTYVLANRNGDLAVFRVGKSGALRHIAEAA